MSRRLGHPSTAIILRSTAHLRRRAPRRVVVAPGFGMLVLAPSLWLLYRLVLHGTLDQGFEPLDQRFRPISAGDRREDRR